jgi:hypothetical protein
MKKEASVMDVVKGVGTIAGHTLAGGIKGGIIGGAIGGAAGAGFFGGTEGTMEHLKVDPNSETWKTHRDAAGNTAMDAVRAGLTVGGTLGAVKGALGGTYHAFKNWSDRKKQEEAEEAARRQHAAFMHKFHPHAE